MGDDDLRGYFTKNGTYKKYSIAGNDWLVNSEKIYAHDDGEENIIDAEIAEDDGIYTVEKNNTGSVPDNYDDCIYQVTVHSEAMYSFSLARLGMNSVEATYRKGNTLSYTISLNGVEYFRADDDVYKDSELNIKKDGSIIKTLKLSQLCEKAEAEARSNVTFVDVSAVFPEDYINSRAILQNFKILPNGKWEALILCEIWTERGFTYESNPTAKATRVNVTTTTTETKMEGNTSLHQEITFVNVTQQPEPIPSMLYSSTMAHCLYLFKVTSDDDIEYAFKSLFAYPLNLVQYIGTITEGRPINKEITSPTSYPYIREYDATDNLFLDQNGNIFAPDFDSSDETRALRYCSRYSYYFNSFREWGWNREYIYFSGVYKLSTQYVYNSQYSPNRTIIYGVENLEITERFTFPVQEDYQARIRNSGDIGTWQLDGIYDGNKKIFDIASSATDAHKWNMELASLKGSKFLFGIHDGALYKIDSNGNATQVGGGLKNFRLRELKKISKAKK